MSLGLEEWYLIRLQNSGESEDCYWCRLCTIITFFNHRHGFYAEGFYVEGFYAECFYAEGFNVEGFYAV